MNEWEIIAKIRKTMNTRRKNFSQIGDDVAYLVRDGEKVIVKADMLVEKTDVPPSMTYRQAARKSIVSCVSDFAAKGVRPKAVVLSIGLARGTGDQKVSDLVQGFRDAKEEFGVEVIGGDTNETDSLVIDCTMVGISNHIIPRSGAKPGDIIITSGLFGYTSVGMEILLRSSNANQPLRDLAVSSVLEPKPSLEFGLLAKDYVTASIDSSDGLAISLHQLARASDVGIALEALPVDPRIFSFARDHSLSVFDLVLYGGEEFHVISTVSSRRFNDLLKVARKRGVTIYRVGKVNSNRGKVVLGGTPNLKIENRGWTHLS